MNTTAKFSLQTGRSWLLYLFIYISWYMFISVLSFYRSSNSQYSLKIRLWLKQNTWVKEARKLDASDGKIGLLPHHSKEWIFFEGSYWVCLRGIASYALRQRLCFVIISLFLFLLIGYIPNQIKSGVLWTLRNCSSSVSLWGHFEVWHTFFLFLFNLIWKGISPSFLLNPIGTLYACVTSGTPKWRAREANVPLTNIKLHQNKTELKGLFFSLSRWFYIEFWTSGNLFKTQSLLNFWVRWKQSFFFEKIV